MMVRLDSSDLVGIDAVPVEVEVDVQPGMPSYITVGLPDAAIRESRERVRGAILNSGYQYPFEQVTVNLAPADIRKEGSQLDLPIALALLAATGQIGLRKNHTSYVVVGELALNGSLRPVRGVLAMASMARARGSAVLLPAVNAAEAAIVEGLQVLPAGNLAEAVEFMRGAAQIEPHPRLSYRELLEDPPTRLDFADVKGQAHVKRALEVAAAGGHNVFMMGPPGSGKSMLAKRFPTILPPMSFEEALETTRIHSARGETSKKNGILTVRPFRAPHHTISYAGMIGGGANVLPGQVSLAHNGVLFLDELTEFKRDVLESLRQPIEDRAVTISRAKGSLSFPASFTLIAATNPCPCGYYGDPGRTCRCTPPMIQRYLSKLSGPLLDRMDLQVEVSAIPPAELRDVGTGEPSRSIRARVVKAREKQWARFEGTHVYANAQMDERMVEAYCPLDPKSEAFLLSAMKTLSITARGHHRILKVARTIADIEDLEAITAQHLAEAIQYRTLDRKLFST